VGDIIFACDARNYISRQTEYRGPKKQEYFEGDYQILPSSYVEVCIEKGLAGPFPIFNLRTRSELRFRRSWNHIRCDKIDVTIIWFVKHGRLAISSHRGRTITKSGEFTITRSSQPFYTESLVDEESIHEALHVAVPTHILRSYVPDDVNNGAIFSFRQGDCHVAERTLRALFEEGPNVDRQQAEDFERSALGAVGHCMSESISPTPPRTLGARRLDDILDHIQMHLSNPDLTVDAVASGCGISTRYLIQILKLHETRFSDLLWRGRVDRTKALLAAKNMRHVTIGEIAYRAGFKSPAHFSRMFKRVTNKTPRNFRASSIPKVQSTKALTDRTISP
jgi:AraC-like DNA-binding protein